MGSQPPAPEVRLEDAKEHFYGALRSCERFSESLKKVLDELNTKQEDDPWLELTKQVVAKGHNFHQQQANTWDNFQKRFTDYFDDMKREAERLGLLELSGRPAGDDDEGSQRTVHPELLRYKIEKQAKIVGKYGGVSIFPNGMPLPKPADLHLRATASPAAKEIKYSQIEGDAATLADVMKFKAREVASSPSPWQQEMQARRGSRNSGGGNPEPPAPPPVTDELANALRRRQEASAAASASAAAAEAAAAAAAVAAAPQDLSKVPAELAAKLRKRQSALNHGDAGGSTSEPGTPDKASGSNS